MEGEYKMFIDSLSERNKSKNAVKASTPVSGKLLIICYLILLLLMNASTPSSDYTFSRETIP